MTSKRPLIAYYSAINNAIKGHDLEMAAKLIALMAVDGYAREAGELRQAITGMHIATKHITSQEDS